MTTPLSVSFIETQLVDLAGDEGTVVVFTGSDGALTSAAAHVDGLLGGALARAMQDAGAKGGSKGSTAKKLAYPAGMSAKSVVLAGLGEDASRESARKTGGSIAAAAERGTVTLCVDGAADMDLVAEMIFAFVSRCYEFTPYKKAQSDEKPTWTLNVMSETPEALAAASAPFAALSEGIFFTRDLVNEPANTLTTDEFAARLAAMGEMGLEVEILGEKELEAMGAGAFLGVGLGSDNETKMVVMKWMGGGDEAPLALVGKGVIFDTGGISLKPSMGMEDMTMDMGGAGVVSGVMRTLALRKAKANVVGVVGLVENMPDARAQRPGDIVTSMKGETIEVINTDAEGRLVLADVLWYTQETFKPSGVIDLATLTGAVIVALSKSRAGHFCNDDDFNAAYEAACKEAGNATWRLPLDKAYHDQMKSTFADIKNSGGRNGGSCTAAAFLEAFIKDGMPWIHIDIAGVTTQGGANHLGPKGATGWGVAALDELVRSREIG
ncbi:MAG: leucyl aminopeptidase [Paracoccaceae bacterium]